MKFFLIALLYTQYAHSFLLNTNISASFDSKTVKIYVTSNSLCENAGITNTTLLDLAMEASHDFWNKVPTSSLRLKRGGILQTTDANFLTEELCAQDSTQACEVATSVPLVSDIVIACNRNTTENFPNSEFLAITAPTNLSGSSIKGSVILINDSENSVFSKLSKAEILSALAHEIGHAIGIGHSNKKEALMYHKNSDQMQRLSQDDIDAVTYLYPNKLDGCSGIFSGTIKIQGDSNYKRKQNLFEFILSFLLGMSMYLLLSKISIYLRKTRSTLL